MDPLGGMIVKSLSLSPGPKHPGCFGCSASPASKIQDDCGIDSHRTVMVVDLLLVIFMVTWKLAVVMAKGQQ